MALVPFRKTTQTPTADPQPDWDEDRGDGGAGKMSFLDHLDELRRRLVYALVAVVVGFGIALAFIGPIFDFVMAPMQAGLAPGQKLIFTEPTEAIMLYMKMALLAGILLASPAVFAQIWLFIAPGLYQHEKRMAIPFILLGSLCFVGGAAFSHFIIFPPTWQFFSSFESDILAFTPRIEPAFGLYVKLMLVFGVIFQMPTLILFLAKMGLVTAKFLIRNMKYAILIMFILGAVLSPGTDPVSQVMMVAPMFVLYVISIGLAWLFGKKRTATTDAT